MDTHHQTLDLRHQLPRDTYCQVVHTLRGLLPPPEADTPEALICRDNAAIAHVAALLPANADEADLAARVIAHSAYAKDCLRLAGMHRGDLASYLKCAAQAASMERQAQGARRLLQNLQAERRKRDADATAAETDAWTEHCATGYLADALGRTRPAPLEEPPPQPPALAPQDAAPETDLAAEAEQYAIHYPQRAARIRALGGLPQPCDFGPPSPELVQAIVTGSSPALRALDTPRPSALTQRGPGSQRAT